MEIDRELLKGSINLLILTLLSTGPMYGYEIILEAERRSDNAFRFKEGTLYPALHHLERGGFLKSEWRIGPNGRRRRYYALTRKGLSLAEQRGRDWTVFTKAVNAVLTGRLS